MYLCKFDIRLKTADTEGQEQGVSLQRTSFCNDSDSNDFFLL